MNEELILGIETSCDETAAAVVANGKEIRSNIISSQIDLHRRFGGVVPEIASRKHIELMLPVVDTALKQAKVSLQDISAIAVTYGPGLVGALLVGISTAKALAFAADKPLVPVNHIEGHIYANFLAHPEVEPPLVCLTVSGGHTDLLYIEHYGTYQILGRTRDDAAGEAFDKVGRVLGLPYPAGPEIDRLAHEGDPTRYPLPKGMAGEDTYDFSFSGLKTAAINLIHNEQQRGQTINASDFAASLQAAIVEVLAEKTVRAARDRKVRTILLSGGVGANRGLRQRLAQMAKQEGMSLYYPPPVLCTDNAAMIACAGYYRYKRGDVGSLDLNAVPGLKLHES